MNKRNFIWILMFLFALSSTHAVANLTGLQMYFSGDTEDTIGSIVSSDLTTINGTISGNVFNNPGVIDECLNFSDINAYITGSDTNLDIAGAKPYTAQAWSRLNTNAVDTTYRPLFEAGTSNNNQKLWLAHRWHVGSPLCNDVGTDFFGAATCGTGNLIATAGIWHLLTFVYDGTNSKIYINKTLNANAAKTKNTIKTGTWKIGLATSVGGLNGCVDEFVWFNRTLSSSEINESYDTALTGVSYWNPAPASGGINLISQTPANNTQFNYTTIPFDVNINATTNSSLTTLCNLTINSAQVFSDSTTGNGTLSFNTTQVLSEGQQDYYWYCYNDEANVTTSTYTFYVDTIFPLITTNFVNNSMFYNDNLTANFNFTDEQILFSWNISIDGTQVAGNNTLGSVNETSYDLNTNVQSYGVGEHNLLIRVADGHTANKIKDMEVTDGLFNNKLIFKNDYGEVKIQEKGINLFNRFTATKLIDRYSWDFEPDAIKNKYTFTITADNYITIVDAPNTKYKKWLIVDERWLDFMVDDWTPDIDILRISDKEVEVTLKNMKELDKYTFNSIGELNIKTANYTFSVVNATASYTDPLVETEDTTYNLNLTKPSGSNTTATFYFNGSSNSPTKISNGSTWDYYEVNVSIPQINANTTIVESNWNFTFTSPTATLNETTAFNQTIYQILLTNCSTLLLGQEVINWTIKDETTNTNVVSNITGNFEVWFDDPATTRQFSLGWSNTSTPSLCMLPNATLTTTYTLSYGSSGYATKQKSSIAEIINKTPLTEEILYLTPSASSFYVNLLDAKSIGVIGYLLEFYRKDVATGNYTLSESRISDINGNAPFYYLSTNTYKFLIYNTTGDQVEDTGDIYIVTNPTIIKIGAGDTGLLDKVSSLDGVDYSLLYYNSTKIFNLSWTDKGGVTSALCMKVRFTNSTDNTELSDSCSSDAVGSITYNASAYASITGQLQAVAYVQGNHILDSLLVPFTALTKLWQYLGKDGWLWTFIIIALITFAFAFINPVFIPMGVPAGIMIGWILGLIQMSFVLYAPILAMSVAVAIMLKT